VSGPALVTGGAGYVGAVVVDELLASGRSVRVLDVILHDQEGVVGELEARGIEVFRGDIRDPQLRADALRGAEAVVHLAAIVGDPACALDPEQSHEVNVEGTRALLADSRSAGVGRLVFASTCSNYGRMADPAVPIDEDGELAPVSLYAEQKVAMEHEFLSLGPDGPLGTCLRLATVYGVAPRMRFDLTVNEFTRDLWADRELEVFGERFWRPYIHVRDAARAMRTVLEAPDELVAGRVYNAGRSGENYRKLDIVQAIQSEIQSGQVKYVHRDEDPRDYKVSFDRIRSTLGFETLMTVPDGIRELIQALDRGDFPDPFDRAYRNIP
jgi:nucleoside-diphosphate-sugar epimerase